MPGSFMHTALCQPMHGRTYMGANGTTFIIDPEGTVMHVIPKVSPKTHDDEVLAALGELSAA